MVVLETVSVLMQAVVVFVLGVVGASESLQCWSLGSPFSFSFKVLEELELGGTLPWLGEDYAVVAVPDQASGRQKRALRFDCVPSLPSFPLELHARF